MPVYIAVERGRITPALISGQAPAAPCSPLAELPLSMHGLR